MLAWRYKTDKERERERKKIIERKQIKEIGQKVERQAGRTFRGSYEYSLNLHKFERKRRRERERQRERDIAEALANTYKLDQWKML